MYHFQSFIAEHRDLSLQQFAGKFFMPLLLLEKRNLSVRDTLTLLSKTAYMPRPDWILCKKGRTAGAPFPQSCVFNFADTVHPAKIYIGRNTENTLCLKDSSISGFHAYLEKTTAQNWHLCDRDSENGTFINGERLTAHSPHIISPGDGITFSHVYFCTLFTAEQFFAYMQSLSRD